MARASPSPTQLLPEISTRGVKLLVRGGLSPLLFVQSFGFLGLLAAVLMLLALVVRMGHLNDLVDLGDGLALGN